MIRQHPNTQPRRLKHPVLSSFACIGLLLLSGCQSLGTGGGPLGRIPGSEQQMKSGDLSKLQNELVEGAYFVKGKRSLRVNGRTFNSDCTGTVLAIYWYAGIDLARPLENYSGNGVSRLFSYLQDSQLVLETKDPAAGDIIFWDNTYDRNGDTLANDFLTHTGMIVKVEKDGTIHYVHHNYRKGVVFARMNLYKPEVYKEEVDGRPIIVNSPMRMKGSPEYDKWLASELTRSFGRAWMMF